MALARFIINISFLSLFRCLSYSILPKSILFKRNLINPTVDHNNRYRHQNKFFDHISESFADIDDTSLLNNDRISYNNIIFPDSASNRLQLLHNQINSSSDSNTAYKHFLDYKISDVNANKTLETMSLMINMINKDQNWFLIDHVMYHMRSNYSVVPTGDIWYQLIKGASLANDWITARKILFRQMKYGGTYSVPSPKSVVRLLRAMSKAEVWKDIDVLYQKLKSLGIFDQMIDDDKVNYLYEMLLYFNAKKSRWRESMIWMNEMKGLGLTPSRECYRHAVNACNKGSKRIEAAAYLDELQLVHNSGNSRGN